MSHATLAFLLLELSSFILFEKRFRVRSVTRIPFGIFRRYWVKCRTGCAAYKIDNSAFLLLALSPFVIFDSDSPLISCPLCKSKTHWNIFMILDKDVEQDQTMCRVQE